MSASVPARITSPLLEAIDLSKRFGRLPTLERITFSVEPGEVLGIVGRRSSEKSTLLNLLAGVYPPSSGQLQIQGQPMRNWDRRHALRLGIELVPQAPQLVEQFDVMENILLGHEPGQIRVNWERMVERAQEVLHDLEAQASLLRQPVKELSDEQRQVICIARTLSRPARLILLDDALAALSFQRQETVLALIRTLAGRGVSFLIASENLKHLFDVTDRILVLYEGRLVADRRTSDCTARDIVELIVGAGGAEQVTPVIWALESYRTAQRQAEELREVQASLRQSLEAQDSLNRQLINRLGDQVKALDRLNLALQDAHRRLLTQREEERKYLARELHDQVIQDLLSFNYRLEEMEGHEALNGQRQELAGVRAGIRQVVGDLRQLCSDLRPPSIDSHGLAAAIRSHAQEWAARNGLRLILEIDPQLGRLPEAIELSVFRIVQEGLNNIRKHASATEARLLLTRTPYASLVIKLSDNGRGLAQPLDLSKASSDRHFGLLGISERVGLLGGTLKIDTPIGGGLTLAIEIPSPYPSVSPSQ